ncbi:MAG: phage major capsid protein [Bacteroidota bacterium]
MTSNRAMLRKDAITTGALATGGQLNPQQADKFIDYMVEQTQLLQDVTVIRMNSNKYDLDTIGVGSRIIRKAVEATEPTETAGISTGKRQLSTTEIILPFDISLSFLEDNIERAGAEDHIARLFAQQFGNDLVDLAVNGDVDAGAGPDQAFLSIENGWLKILFAVGSGAHIYDNNASQDFKGVVFPAMLAQLPNKFKNNLPDLRFYVSPTAEEAYRSQLSTRQTALGDEYTATGKRAEFMGVKVVPIPYLPVDIHLLTPRLNLCVGIQRQMTTDKERKPRKRIMEYTMTARIDFEVKNPDAVVASKNMP